VPFFWNALYVLTCIKPATTEDCLHCYCSLDSGRINLIPATGKHLSVSDSSNTKLHGTHYNS